MKLSKDAIVLLVLFAALIVGSLMMAGPTRQQESFVSTTYNPDRNGVKALFVLMNRLGYNVNRLFRPYYQIPRHTRLLIVVQPVTVEAGTCCGLKQGIDSYETAKLKRWVEAGGVVIFASDKLEGIPKTFRKTRRMGAGKVYAFDSRRMFTNNGLAYSDNALRVLRIVDQHTTHGDLILFDEYHHGITDEISLNRLSAQVKLCLALLAVAGIVLLHSQAKRFGAVRNLPPNESRRPGFEFVEAVGRLYQKAEASDLAAQILCDSFRQELTQRYGSSESDDAALVDAVRRASNEQTARRTAQVLAQRERAAAGHKPGKHELVNIAREITLLEKELRLGSDHC